jgi:hypothetical protein
MPHVITTKPKMPPGVFTALSTLGVAVVIGAGSWVVTNGLPTGMIANWGVVTIALMLLGGAMFAWRHVDMKQVGIIQRCLILSVLVHVLIAAVFSAVVAVRQTAEVLGIIDATPPTVNLNISRELEVRQQVRQVVSAETPVAPPLPSLVRMEAESPLPKLHERLEPVGVSGMELRQIAIQQAPLTPTVPMAPPAADLTTPLLPVRPEVAPLPMLTPLPTLGGVDTEKKLANPIGPVQEQLAPKLESPLKGSGVGSLGAPPASLALGNVTGGSATGSGTGRAITILGSTTPPRIVDLPIPTVAPPPPSSIELAAPAGPGAMDTLVGRGFDQRQKMLEKYGGTAETEAAVAKALLYLSRVQQGDGHWTKIDADGATKGTDEHDVGLTALSVLCYLAANHTPDHDGAYRDVVRKGLNYLMLTQKANGDLRGAGNMYDHAIAGLALGEAAAMVKDAEMAKRLRTAAHNAAQFVLDAQSNSGGWRYKPNDWFTDTSVTGWQVMALHSAERTGFKVSDDVKLKVIAFLQTVSKGDRGMLSGYLTPAPTLTMTAEAVFTRMLVGQRLSETALREAQEFLENPKREGIDYYYVYYGSLAMMQMQGEPWKKWNAATSKLLVGLQEKAGSFPISTEWGERGGKVYCTALSALSLEVYYRYLPMYAK